MRAAVRSHMPHVPVRRPCGLVRRPSMRGQVLLRYKRLRRRDGEDPNDLFTVEPEIETQCERDDRRQPSNHQVWNRGMERFALTGALRTLRPRTAARMSSRSLTVAVLFTRVSVSAPAWWAHLAAREPSTPLSQATSQVPTARSPHPGPDGGAPTEAFRTRGSRTRNIHHRRYRRGEPRQTDAEMR